MGKKVLITCPPMLGVVDELSALFLEHDWEISTPSVEQTLAPPQLKEMLPDHDGWIIGDDPATVEVLQAGRNGRLRAVVKWGVGIDNVDRGACDRLGIPFANTPNMFGMEVADVAMGYVLGLARSTFEINRGVWDGGWPKPRGMSLAGRTAALIGYGDIGQNISKRLSVSQMEVMVYDPSLTVGDHEGGVTCYEWPNSIERADFIVICCALTRSSKHLLDASLFKRVKPGVRIVNVGRGPVIKESALIEALAAGVVHSAALDVFETEPLSTLR